MSKPKVEANRFRGAVLARFQSFREAALALGVNHGTVSRWCSGLSPVRPMAWVALEKFPVRQRRTA